MKTKNKILLSLVTIMFLSSSSFADESKKDLGEISVIANNNLTENSSSYTIDSMSSATKMDLSILNTPQSISVITSQQMEDFNLNTINDVLDNTTGIEVQRIESDRTRYSSRGFNITNFLVDGVGSSVINGYVYGDIDMLLYDHVEVTRGATGLSSNQGDPSASINMIRKRPTRDFQASTKLSLGSWSKKRLEADVSNSLNDDKSIRARVMAGIEDSKSYLDRYDSKSHVISGIIEADINDNNTITFAITNTKDNNNGTQHGGFTASNLQERNYDISVNPSSDWSYRNTKSSDAFLELDSIFSDKWKLKTTYSYKNSKEENEALNLDPSGLNSVVWSALKYESENKTNLLDLTLNGSYTLFQKEHDLVVSANYTKQKYNYSGATDTSQRGTFIVDLATWDGSGSSRNYGALSYEDYIIKEKSLSIATNFHISEDLSLLLGSKLLNFSEDGNNWAGSYTKKDNGIITPYISAVYKINNNISTYASYTTIFKPQSKLDISGTHLEAEEGINYELGIKSSFFNGALNSSFALFRTKKENFAERVGTINGRTYYKEVDGISSEGYELEISGNIIDSISASLGYTHLSIKDADDEDTLSYIPRRMLNSSLTYSPGEIKGLKIGASVNWKSSSYNSRDKDTVQNSYAIYNLMTSYKVNKKTNISFNVKNISDKRYFASLMKGTYTNYGAARSFGVSLDYKF